MVALIVLGALIFIFLSVVSVFFCYTFVRKPKNSDVVFKGGDEEYFGEYYRFIRDGADFIASQKYEEHRIKSFDGLDLYGRYLKNGDSKKTVMLFHGYRSRGEKDFSGSFKYYVDRGFNVLLVDQRAHGKSGGRLITFGVKESRDKEIFIIGLSMGAATVKFAARFPMPDNVKGVIADCGFNSPEKIIRKVAKQNFRINGFLLMPALNVLCKLFGKFSVYGVSSETALKSLNKPILFIHGTADDFVPYEMSVSGFEAANEPKFLCTVEGAPHGMSYLVDTPKVRKAFDDFIEYCEKR